MHISNLYLSIALNNKIRIVPMHLICVSTCISKYVCVNVCKGSYVYVCIAMVTEHRNASDKTESIGAFLSLHKNVISY